MQEIKQNPLIKQPSWLPWMASIVACLLTLLAIGWLWWYQFVTAATVERLQSEITKLDNDIKSSSLDRDIIIANILSTTTIRPTIDLKALVRGFRVAATEARVRLQWFSVKDDTISTMLIATRDGDTGVDPVETIIAMMRNPDSSSGLNLEPIRALQWSSTERTTAVSFRILPTNPITNVTK